MIAIIIGTGFYSYAIGNLTSLITGVDDDSAELDEKLSQIKEHQESQNLPDKLAQRIADHLIAQQLHKKYENTEVLLANIPPYLREEVVAITHGKVYSKIQFFANATKTNP